MMIRMKSRI